MIVSQTAVRQQTIRKLHLFNFIYNNLLVIYLGLELSCLKVKTTTENIRRIIQQLLNDNWLKTYS